MRSWCAYPYFTAFRAKRTGRLWGAGGGVVRGLVTDDRDERVDGCHPASTTSPGLRKRTLIREFNKIRLSLGRFLVLGLEFQLAGDVLPTAVAPSFTEIGRLAAVAAIRTVLNFFLTREIAPERAEIDGDPKDPLPHATASTSL